MKLGTSTFSWNDNKAEIKKPGKPKRTLFTRSGKWNGLIDKNGDKALLSARNEAALAIGKQGTLKHLDMTGALQAGEIGIKTVLLASKDLIRLYKHNGSQIWTKAPGGNLKHQIGIKPLSDGGYVVPGRDSVVLVGENGKYKKATIQTSFKKMLTFPTAAIGISRDQIVMISKPSAPIKKSAHSSGAINHQLIAYDDSVAAICSRSMVVICNPSKNKIIKKSVNGKITSVKVKDSQIFIKTTTKTYTFDDVGKQV